jgi:lambda family phage minor tail protein L
MTYNVNATFSSEQVKLSGTHPVESYVLNASLSGWNPLYYVALNQDIFGYGMLASGTLTATGDKTYTGLPIQRGDIANTTDGRISEVSISIPNVDRIIESVIQNNDYLRGRDVYILTGFAKHLPSGATAKHIGSDSDRFSIIKEKLYIDSTTSNSEIVTFTCKPKFVIKNMTIPSRTYSRDCGWAFKGRYVGSECDPLASVDTVTYPDCDGTLENCRARANTKRFGGFTSIPSRGIVILS